MAIPSLVAAAAGSDKGKRFLSGFTDFLTGGMTDFDKRGDSRLQEFQKNQAKRNIEAAQGFGDFITGGMTDFDQRGDSRLQEFQKNQAKRNIEAAGSLAKNAMALVGINGTQRMDTGETSQGAQELAQKVEQNEKTGVQQRLADFMNRINPFDRVFPDNRVDYVNPDGTTQKVNPDFDKLLKNRPDLKERFDRTGSIYSDM